MGAGEPSPTDTGTSPDDSAAPAPEDTGEPPAPDDPCDAPDLSDGFPSGTEDCADGRCVVEAGSFFMGSIEGHDDECPVRQIELSTYIIDKDEVTWGGYGACVEAGVCTATPEWCQARAEGLSPAGVDELPVFCVTWSQARDYCAHVDGRLPTEAEWEKAARGTRGSKWPWGDAVPTCDFANFRFVSWYCQPGVVAVGSFENASPYGVRDMVGNAWEWVDDAYDAEWYRVSTNTNPVGPTEDCHDAVGADTGPCVERVIRGGAFNVTEFNTRSAARSAAEPDRVDDNIGFRCAYGAPD
jgi:formylglycine-generating enzyme